MRRVWQLSTQQMSCCGCGALGAAKRVSRLGTLYEVKFRPRNRCQHRPSSPRQRMRLPTLPGLELVCDKLGKKYNFGREQYWSVIAATIITYASYYLETSAVQLSTLTSKDALPGQQCCAIGPGSSSAARMFSANARE